MSTHFTLMATAIVATALKIRPCVRCAPVCAVLMCGNTTHAQFILNHKLKKQKQKQNSDPPLSHRFSSSVQKLYTHTSECAYVLLLVVYAPCVCVQIYMSAAWMQSCPEQWAAASVGSRSCPVQSFRWVSESVTETCPSPSLPPDLLHML